MLSFLKRERFWNVPYSIFPSVYSINTPGCSSSCRTNATATMGGRGRCPLQLADCSCICHFIWGGITFKTIL